MKNLLSAMNNLENAANQMAADETQQTAVLAHTDETPDIDRLVSADISQLSREALVDFAAKLAKLDKVLPVVKVFDAAKRRFDVLTGDINSALYEKFIAEGGDKLDFRPSPDEHETKMRALAATMQQRRKAEHDAMERDREHNVLVKRNILDNMARLLDNSDIDAVSNRFREYMNQWKGVGPVPQADYSDINASYNNYVNQFFAKVRMAREIRELDMKRNYDEKVKICEAAEALLGTPSARKAYYTVQQMHSQWKAIGPVRRELKEDLWQRFKAASAAVAEWYKAASQNVHEQERLNYEQKLALIAEVEALLPRMTGMKECDKVLDQVKEIMAKWRTIGFAPKQYNEEVYETFRNLCDAVYNRRRAVKAERDNIADANKAKLEALCASAEALASSTDWKTTSDALKELQRQWKEVGYVPREISKKLWNRFRAACDTFFNNKAQYLEGQQGEYENNLKLKQALIDELRGCQMPDDVEEHFKVLRGFQQRWNAIGYVPAKAKGQITAEFSELMNQQFDKLNTDDFNRNVQRYRSKAELMAADHDGKEKLLHERNKMINKLKQMENDLQVFENNVGFFAKSETSDAMVSDVNAKISRARYTIDQINAKLDILDELLD